MNRGFGIYFSGGVKASVNTIYKNKGFLLVWLYTALAFIGRLTVIFAPIFDLADIRQAKLVHAENRAHVAQHFSVACKAKALWAYYGAILLEALICLGGLVLIGIATGFLALLGLLVSYGAPSFPQLYLMLIFCAPGALAALAYLVILPVFFAPTPYIVESNPGISAAATVSACFKTMRRCGKWTCILNTAIPTLIIGGVISVFSGLISLSNIIIPNPMAALVLRVLLLMLAAAAFLCIYPIFNLTRKVAQKSLFEDICLDPVNASKHTSGVNIQRCRGVLFETETIEENLSVLFDETEDESTPLPSSKARNKHDESARMGVEKVDLSQGEEQDNSDRQDVS